MISAKEKDPPGCPLWAAYVISMTSFLSRRAICSSRTMVPIDVTSLPPRTLPCYDLLCLCNNVFDRQTVLLVKKSGLAGLRKAVIQCDLFHRNRPVRDKTLRDSSACASNAVVVFGNYKRSGRACVLHERFLVQWLHAAQVYNRSVDRRSLQ